MKKAKFLAILFSVLLLGCASIEYEGVECEDEANYVKRKSCYQTQAVALVLNEDICGPEVNGIRDCEREAIELCDEIEGGLLEGREGRNMCVKEVADAANNPQICDEINLDLGLIDTAKLLFNEDALIKSCKRRARPASAPCTSFAFFIFLPLAFLILKKN